MSSKEHREILEKQLRLLSEESVKAESDLALVEMTRAMAEIVRLLRSIL